MDVETAVGERYSAGARRVEPALCCCVSYRPELLKAIPPEVIEKDYGCGDPTEYVRAGETVLDLGSGSGKICFIASQVVGSNGKVIGIDLNDEMLALSRRARVEVARHLGYDNVTFRKGKIQDLALDLDLLNTALSERPINSATDYLAAERIARDLRATRPMVPRESIDVVISNCVLNLVDGAEKSKLFDELYAVLRFGGRAVISDIVAGVDVPKAMQEDPELWSGCISGALREDRFIAAFKESGFQALRVLKRDAKPWQMVNGIEFRSVTVEAWKLDGVVSGGPSRVVMYKGPFQEVVDDQGRRFRRGELRSVAAGTSIQLGLEPYAGHFYLLDSSSGATDATGSEFSADRASDRQPSGSPCC
jgi:arsenite methyltransferase